MYARRTLSAVAPGVSSPMLAPSLRDERVQIHLRRPRLPLTAVSAVCSSRTLPDPLVATISDFITRKGWSIASACRRGDLQLLQRIIAAEASCMHPLYRSHTFSEELGSAVQHDNGIELIECLCAYCPTGFAGEGMADAASLGKVDVLDWLVANHANVTLNSDLLDKAAEGGHLNVLQWLKTKFPEGELDWEDALEIASSRGYLDIVKWIHENTTIPATADHKYRLREADREALKYLFEHGYEHIGFSEPVDVDLLSYWSRPLKKWLEGCFHTAVHNGRADSVRWFIERELNMFDYDSAFENAVGNGDLDIVQLLYDLVPTSVQHQALESAAIFGHLDIVQWLFQLLHEHNLDEEVGGVAATRTPRRVLLEIAEMLHTMRDEDRSVRCNTSDAALDAHFSIAKWLVENSVPLGGTHDMDEAASCGRLEMLIWLHEKSNASCSVHAMAHAAAGNHLDVVKWLHENRSEGCTTNAMDGAAGNGHLEVVKWLDDNRSEGCTAKAMDDAATYGHLEVVKWLHEHRNEGCTYKAMDGAARNGYLNVVKWLHENRNEGCSTGAMDESAKNGHLRVVKWLHENRTEGCTTWAMDNATSFEIVEWLHTNRSEGCTTDAMDNALERGDVDTLLLLCENRTEGCTTQAAVIAYYCRYVDVFQWLLEKFPDVLKLEEILEEVGGDPDSMTNFLEDVERVERQRIG